MDKIELQETLAEFNFVSELYGGLVRQYAQNENHLKSTQGKHIKALALKEKLKHDMDAIREPLEEMHKNLLTHYKAKWEIKEFKFLEI